MVYEGMLVFNRELEEARREREKRELEWQAELEESMKKSDPTGHGNVVLLWCGIGFLRYGDLVEESGIVLCDSGILVWLGLVLSGVVIW